MVFLWRFCFVIEERFVGLARLESPVFLRFTRPFYVEKQHREEHRTKNSPKPATNCENNPMSSYRYVMSSFN